MLCQRCLRDFPYKQVTCPKKWCPECKVIVDRANDRRNKKEHRVREALREQRITPEGKRNEQYIEHHAGEGSSRATLVPWRKRDDAGNCD